MGSWRSGNATPLHGEERQFESDRVHHSGVAQRQSSGLISRVCESDSHPRYHIARQTRCHRS